MATNLRLRPDAEAALRAEAQRSGRSQQKILRDAIDRYLNLARGDSASGDALLRSGTLLPPRTRQSGSPGRSLMLFRMFRLIVAVSWNTQGQPGQDLGISLPARYQ